MDTSTIVPEVPTERKRRGKPRIPMPSTLRPESIASGRERIYDLSGMTHPSFWTSDGKQCRMIYVPRQSRLGISSHRTFPPNTKGYFYYHRSAGCSELAGGIRFRLCEGPEDFERGFDLLTPSGKPWGYPLLELACHSNSEPFLALAQAEGFVQEGTVHAVRELGLQREQYRSLILYSIAEPFVFDLAASKQDIKIITIKKVVIVSFMMQKFAEYMKSQDGKRHWIFPLTGSVKLQLELSMLPEHAPLGPTLVLRVLEVIKPVTMDPNYTGLVVVPPEPGTLVYRISRGKKRVVCMPIHRQRMSADILELAKEAWLNADI
ncbi:hypothetical protein BDN70DRAFT_883804 [Pholiota conissans]|uniref:Uncharacterized protein n=1 Tax=Pholiota conissans TaxID=109636 RepID=A0A9P5YWX5_9AGAR|nr:hypothetical protein BDN70DRAFT_883804 [Pholiota conissans]